jgi:ABC-2 type transport system ATP-binding protein
MIRGKGMAGWDASQAVAAYPRRGGCFGPERSRSAINSISRYRAIRCARAAPLSLFDPERSRGPEGMPPPIPLPPFPPYTIAMIRLENLGKSYGTRTRPVHALRDASLEIGPGVWAVVGPNGAGKSTLLGLVLGFLRPSTGAVTLEGMSPRRYLRRHGAAFLPERFRLPPEWPVRAALRTLARLEGTAGSAPGEDARTRADAAIARLGLEEHADKTMGALSRGLNQRVGLAQALLADRPLVVLDEPTEGLDPLWRVRFRDLVAELRAAGRTVLLASHELGEIERVADRAIVLEDGRIRDVLDVQGPAGPATRYRLDVDAPAHALDLAFPGAEASGRAVTVTVADPAELSHRLAALLDAGGVVRSVVPETGLEERVRQRLEDS